MMFLLRRFEEKIIEVYPQQEMKTPVHIYIGQEAIAAGVCIHLKPDDFLFSTHRNHAHCLAKGADPEKLYAEFYGRITGCCKGMGGSMHPAFPDIGILGTSAIVGGGIPHAVGTALSSKFRKDDKISVVFFGDGASEQGVFHESLNFAVLQKLPVLFVCENNGYATASPLASRQPDSDISKRIKGYGIPAQKIDGNDVREVYRTSQKLLTHIRSGAGPAFIEAITYRWKGHVGVEEDWNNNVRPKDELSLWKQRCPLNLIENWLMESGILPSSFEGINAQIEAVLDEALCTAYAGPMPSSKQMLSCLFHKTGEVKI